MSFEADKTLLHNAKFHTGTTHYALLSTMSSSTPAGVDPQAHQRNMIQVSGDVPTIPWVRSRVWDGAHNPGLIWNILGNSVLIYEHKKYTASRFWIFSSARLASRLNARGVKSMKSMIDNNRYTLINWYWKSMTNRRSFLCYDWLVIGFPH